MSNYFVVIIYFLFQASVILKQDSQPLTLHSTNRYVATYQLPDRGIEKILFVRWIRLIHEICYLLVAAYSVNIVGLLNYVIPCNPDAMGYIGENGISQEK